MNKMDLETLLQHCIRENTWGLSLDAKFVDGKIDYTKFEGSRGRYGSSGRIPHEDVLAAEDRSRNDSSVMQLVFHFLGVDVPNFSSDTLLEIKRSEYPSDQVKPEFTLLHQNVKKYNEVVEELNTLKQNELSAEISRIKKSFSKFGELEISNRTKYTCFKEPKPYPSEWFLKVTALTLLVPWNSELGKRFSQNPSKRVDTI